jgi:hypothetical protein
MLILFGIELAFSFFGILKHSIGSSHRTQRQVAARLMSAIGPDISVFERVRAPRPSRRPATLLSGKALDPRSGSNLRPWTASCQLQESESTFRNTH